MQRWAQHLKWAAPLAAVVTLALIYAFPPTEYALYPQCLFRSLTGLACPGCGSLRSLHHFLHGNIATAFLLNPLLYVLAPALVVCRSRLHRPVWLWSFVGVIVLFTVARNL